MSTPSPTDSTPPTEQTTEAEVLKNIKPEPFTLQFDRYHSFDVSNQGDVSKTISMIDYLRKQNISNTQRCAEACFDFDMQSLKQNTEGIRSGMQPHEQLCLETCYRKLTASSDLFLQRHLQAMDRHVRMQQQ